MKWIMLAALLSLIVAGCQTDTTSPKVTRVLSAGQVNEQIAGLRKLIIPPEGTGKTAIDAVFGQATVVQKRTKGGRYVSPVHIYQLLSPERGQDSRAILFVTYKEGKAHFVDINHMCVTKGRPIFADPKKFTAEREAENRLVLFDLLEIKKKYEDKLKDAVWNKQASEHSPAN